MALNFSRKQQLGFSLIELLVAVIIFSVGLLGMMAMQTSSLIASRDGNIRAQASALLEDMAERIQTNAPAFTAISLIRNPNATDCTTTRCTPNQLAEYDINHWQTQIATQLPGAIGSIAQNGNSFTVTINWNETQWSGTGRASTNTSLAITVGNGS